MSTESFINNFGQPVGKPIPKQNFLPPSENSLTGRYCHLERINVAKHSKILYENVYKNKKTFTYLAIPYYETQEAFNEYCLKMQNSQDPFYFAISPKDDPHNYVGSISIGFIDTVHGVAEISWVVFSAKMQRTMMSTEASFLIAQYVMDVLRYRRLQWKCNSLNAPSRNAALRLGFKYEATFRNGWIVTGNHNCNTQWFAFTDDDWPTVKANLLKWLSPDNFDANGKQKVSLSVLNNVPKYFPSHLIEASTLRNEFGQLLGKTLNRTQFEAPSAPVLEGQYCRLERVNVAKHAKSLFENVYGPDSPAPLWTYLATTNYQRMEDFLPVLQLMEKSTDPLYYVIIRKSEDAHRNDPRRPEEGTTEEIVGTFSLCNTAVPHGTTEVGWVTYSQRMRRTRCATEAQFLLASYVFDTLGYRRLQWQCDSLNQNSRNAALRFGYTCEGTFRNARIVKGRSRDTAFFSITDEEWKNRVCKNVQKWLSKDNFDDTTGKQKVSLRTLTLASEGGSKL